MTLSITERYAQKAKKPEPKALPDDRFKSARFKESVRKVLTELGLECNYGNFRLWDGLIDWEKVASNSNTHYAICRLCDDQGEVIFDTSVMIEIKADGKVSALSKINNRVYCFKEWW